MTFWLGALADAGTATAVLFVVSIGLYVTYGVLRIVNMAHGAMMMVGAYLAAFACHAGMPFVPSLLIAAAAVGLLGIVVEHIVIRPLHSREDLSTLLATWGIGLMLSESIRIFFGPSGTSIELPTNTLLRFAGVPYPMYSVALVTFAAGAFAVTAAILAFTRAGVVLRAIIENPQLAALRGFRVDVVRALAFGFGSALTACAGTLVGPIAGITPTMGDEFTVLAFLVVIVAGPMGFRSGGSGTSADNRPAAIGVSMVMPCLLASGIVAGTRSLLNSLVGVTPATLGMLGVTFLVLVTRSYGARPS